MLAEVDENLHKISGRISDLDGEEVHLKERISQVDAAFSRRKEEHRKLRQTAQERTLEVDATDAKIREYQRKLEHDIVPYKEMEFLRDQVQILRQKLDQLSEEALRLMEAVEEDAKKLSEEEVQYRERRGSLEREIQQVSQRREELKREREALEGKREEILAQLPSSLQAALRKAQGPRSQPCGLREWANLRRLPPPAFRGHAP
jgi:chromosome segregation ATPase